MRQTEVKSTPAPWRVIHKTSNHGAMASTVTTVEDWTPDGIKSVVAVLEDRNATEANARLIAKAPEMAEMVKELLEELRLIRMKDCAAVYDPTVRVRAQTLLNELGPR